MTKRLVWLTLFTLLLATVLEARDYRVVTGGTYEIMARDIWKAALGREVTVRSVPSQGSRYNIVVTTTREVDMSIVQVRCPVLYGFIQSRSGL